VELLKQGQYAPFPVEEQVVSIFLGTQGHLDSVPVADIGRFESEFLEYVRRNEEGVLSEIRDTGKLSDELSERIVNAVKAFKKDFTAADGSSVVPKEKQADAMDEDEVDRESVKVNKPAPAKS
jgi:F-type H+-transporting ATPase subunit alpha